MASAIPLNAAYLRQLSTMMVVLLQSIVTPNDLPPTIRHHVIRNAAGSFYRSPLRAWAHHRSFCFLTFGWVYSLYPHNGLRQLSKE